MVTGGPCMEHIISSYFLGLLAYSNWDDHIENHPHIGLAGMDGEDLVILVNDSIRWPNGLAFDMPSDRLFWGEAYYDLLESIR